MKMQMLPFILSGSQNKMIVVNVREWFIRRRGVDRKGRQVRVMGMH